MKLERFVLRLFMCQELEERTINRDLTIMEVSVTKSGKVTRNILDQIILHTVSFYDT